MLELTSRSIKSAVKKGELLSTISNNYDEIISTFSGPIVVEKCQNSLFYNDNDRTIAFPRILESYWNLLKS